MECCKTYLFGFDAYTAKLDSFVFCLAAWIVMEDDVAKDGREAN